MESNGELFGSVENFDLKVNGFFSEKGKSLPKDVKNKLKDDFKEMRDFSEFYGEENVLNDVEKVVQIVGNLNEKDELEGKNEFGEKTGDDLEYLFSEKAELSNWFGEESYISKTIIYDDLVNGVDMVLEFVDEDSSKKVALMIDCTMDNGDRVTSKVYRNVRNIKAAGGSELKYFKSAYSGEKEEGVIAIPVVVGLDSKHVEELIDNKNNHYFLEKSPAQIVFLREINNQLAMYKSELSNSVVENYRGEVIEEIDRIRGLIRDVSLSKKELIKEGDVDRYIKNDNVFAGINRVISELKK